MCAARCGDGQSEVGVRQFEMWFAFGDGGWISGEGWLGGQECGSASYFALVE